MEPFMFAEGAVPAIAGQMSWFVVHGPQDCDFGVGWLSSPDIEATCPLDPSAALVAVPGPPELGHFDALRGEVEEINLRTYASAEWAIYGQSPGDVQRVRAQAKREKLRVGQLAPVPPTIHIFEQTGGEPGKVQRLRPKGEVKRRQRWPRWED